MSDITVINDSEQSSLVTNGLAKNGELYLKAAGSTDAGAIVVYDSGSWRTFANEASSGFANTYSLSYDGADDIMNVSSDSSLQFATGGFTWSAWIKVTTAKNQTVVRRATGANGYQFVVKSNGQIAYYGGNTGFSIVPLAPSGSISTNTWHHVAFTHDRTNVKGYVDGVNNAAWDRVDSYIPVLDDTTIGYNQDAASYTFAGLIDEVSVFNSALSASDISTIYSGGTPDDISSLNPIGWWRMGDNDSGTGTTVTDQGSGGNDGTLTNGPTFSTDVPS
jgi:hypothetical protein